MASDLHQKSIVVDGLLISDFGREVFEDMRRGGLTAANCTCCVWEGFTETMRNVMRWKDWFRQHDDLITQIYTAKDIAAAKRAGRTGIILGWQNLTGIEDQIGYLGLFKELGVGIMQIAYNTQNLVGTGCWLLAMQKQVPWLLGSLVHRFIERLGKWLTQDDSQQIRKQVPHA